MNNCNSRNKLLFSASPSRPPRLVLMGGGERGEGGWTQTVSTPANQAIILIVLCMWPRPPRPPPVGGKSRCRNYNLEGAGGGGKEKLTLKRTRTKRNSTPTGPAKKQKPKNKIPIQKKKKARSGAGAKTRQPSTKRICRPCRVRRRMGWGQGSCARFAAARRSPPPPKKRSTPASAEGSKKKKIKKTNANEPQKYETGGPDGVSQGSWVWLGLDLEGWGDCRR